jgi:hypothetical protein
VSVPDAGYSRNVLWAYLMKVILETCCERTWWRLFRKRVVSVIVEGYSRNVLWAYLMKVILSVLDEGYSLSVLDAGYFERTWWRFFERTWWRLFWAYLMKVILSVLDEGYFEHTWWRLFWAYLMKVILSVPDEDYSRNTLCTLNLISTFCHNKPTAKIASTHIFFYQEILKG